jgi:hypothetical protein
VKEFGALAPVEIVRAGRPATGGAEHGPKGPLFHGSIDFEKIPGGKYIGIQFQNSKSKLQT